MGRHARNHEDAHRIRQEQERLRKQRKREQLRLAQYTDPLAQLANVETQRKYLKQQNEVNVEAVVNESLTEEAEKAEAEAEAEEREGEGEATEVCGIVEEEGEVLENVVASGLRGGFNNDWEDDGFGCGDDGMGWDMNEIGIQSQRIANGRRKCQGRGIEKYRVKRTNVY
jgi:hypothetical protein